MIGGDDITMQAGNPRAAMDLTIRVVRHAWPDVVIVNARSGERYADIAAVPFSEISELFLYRSADAKQSWDTLGASDVHANSMLHLLCIDNRLTVVVDDPADPSIQPILAAIRDALRIDILNLVAETTRENAA